MKKQAQAVLERALQRESGDAMADDLEVQGLPFPETFD